jgi:hypothetical protein
MLSVTFKTAGLSEDETPCLVGRREDTGETTLTTLWQPSSDDIQAILEGRPVAVEIEVKDFQEWIPAIRVFTHDKLNNAND